jgi:hypothetical protein
MTSCGISTHRACSRSQANHRSPRISAVVGSQSPISSGEQQAEDAAHTDTHGRQLRRFVGNVLWDSPHI